MHAPRHARLMIVLVLVAAGAAGFVVYRKLAPANPDATVTSVPAPVEQPMTAEQALDARFEDLDTGKARALADWHGKAVLVNYWATWCAPCRQEIPLLVKLQAKYAAQGLQVVGIATDEVEADDVKAFLKRMVVNYPMLMGDESVGRMVGGFGGNLIGLPYTVLLGRDGKVLTSHAGELHADEAEAMVSQALGLPAPAPASAPAPAATTAPAQVAAK